jgi:hypothetical protein
MLLIPYLYEDEMEISVLNASGFKTSRSNVPNHCWAFEGDAPSVHMHVLWEAHRLEHLGTEHPAVPHLNPFV